MTDTKCTIAAQEFINKMFAKADRTHTSSFSNDLTRKMLAVTFEYAYRRGLIDAATVLTEKIETEFPGARVPGGDR